MNVTDTILSQSPSRSPWSSFNGLHPFPPMRRNFLCLECFPLFKGLIPLSFKSRLWIPQQVYLTSVYFLFWAFNTIWKSCICLFLLSALFPYTQNFTRSRATFSATGNQLPQCSGNLLSPLYLTGPRSRPGSGRGRSRRCNLGVVVKATQRHRGWKRKFIAVFIAVTRVWGSKWKANTYPDLVSHAGAQTQEGEQRGKIPTTPREAIVMGAPASGRKARSLPAALP